MFYKVIARLKEASAAELWSRIQDGSIAKQKPDGAELVASMRRAVVLPSGEVEWSEQCFCDTPLAHERSTVLDHYFDAITTEVVDGYQQHSGRALLERLQELAEARD